jgi:hypothetical protein
MQTNDSGDRHEARAAPIYREHRQRVAATTDRLYAAVLLVQWTVALAAALCFAPRPDALANGFGWARANTAAGHLAVATCVGGLLAVGPGLLALWQPGRAMTRYAISVGMMLLANLLVRLTGGQWATACGSLVVLALLGRYRDWPVIVTAAGTLLLEHVARGFRWRATSAGRWPRRSF